MTKITDIKKELLDYKKNDKYNFDLELVDACTRYNLYDYYDEFIKFVCEHLNYEKMPEPIKIL